MNGVFVSNPQRQESGLTVSDRLLALADPVVDSRSGKTPILAIMETASSEELQFAEAQLMSALKETGCLARPRSVREVSPEEQRIGRICYFTLNEIFQRLSRGSPEQKMEASHVYTAKMDRIAEVLKNTCETVNYLNRSAYISLNERFSSDASGWKYLPNRIVLQHPEVIANRKEVIWGEYSPKEIDVNSRQVIDLEEGQRRAALMSELVREFSQSDNNSLDGTPLPQRPSE